MQRAGATLNLRCTACHCGGFSSCLAQDLGPSGFRSCGTWAQQLWLPGLVAQRHVGPSQIRDQTVSSASAGRLLTTEPLGKSGLLLSACPWMTFRRFLSHFLASFSARLLYLDVQQLQHTKAVFPDALGPRTFYACVTCCILYLECLSCLLPGAFKSNPGVTQRNLVPSTPQSKQDPVLPHSVLLHW